MKNNILLIVGITLFILVITSSHMLLSVGGNREEVKEKVVSNGENINYNGQFLTPVENYIKVSSKYGIRIHPLTKKQSFHTGIDLVGENGSYILSIGNGVVFKISKSNIYGNTIEIRHTDENGNTFYSFYAHLRDNSIIVEENQPIKEGQRIGIQGSTGWSTGDHLHFEIRKSNHDHIDPTEFLFERI